MALRRQLYFVRFALSVQYHGAAFLGVTRQVQHENTLLLDQNGGAGDLRGFFSVETRLRQALRQFLAPLHEYGGRRKNPQYHQHQQEQQDPTTTTVPLFENLQVSSRTDRGVHALHNTFHVDIRVPTYCLPMDEKNGDDGNNKENDDNNGVSANQSQNHASHQNINNSDNNENKRTEHPNQSNNSPNKNQQQTNAQWLPPSLAPHVLVRGLNHCLQKMPSSTSTNTHNASLNVGHQLRVLNAKVAPDTMCVPVYYHDDEKSEGEDDCNNQPQRFQSQEPQSQPQSQSQPEQYQDIDWHVRFSATERTYLYRILVQPRHVHDWFPMEHDRAWIYTTPSSRIIHIQNDDDDQQQQDGSSSSTPTAATSSVNIAAMREAAAHLTGTHDFSTFRNRGCQRRDPVVTLRDIRIHATPYDAATTMGLVHNTTGHLVDNGTNADDDDDDDAASGQEANDAMQPLSSTTQLITIRIRGNAFLYRQVRNLVSCLMDVGLSSSDYNHKKNGSEDCHNNNKNNNNNRKHNPLTPDDMPRLLAAKNRSALLSTTAPPQGLFLVHVQHGDDFGV